MNTNNEENYISEKDMAPEDNKNKGEKNNRLFLARIKPKIKTAILIAVGFFIGFEAGFFAYYAYLPYKRAADYEKRMDAMLKPYAEDFIGGDTPEQTIDLFIDALKKGDMDLASKYFMVGEQEKWNKILKESNKEQIDIQIEEMEKAKVIWHKETVSKESIEFWYDIKEGEPSRDINLIKNINNKWKIESL